MSKTRTKAHKLTGMTNITPGAAPGTLVPPVGASPPQMRVFAYGPHELMERRLSSIDGVFELTRTWPVVWLDVDGLADAPLVQSIGDAFNLHRLALEDVMDVRQRAKVEEYPEHLFFITRMTSLLDEELTAEQLSIFLGKGYVITFQEHPGDCFDPVRDRLRKGRGRLRSSAPDYLAYTLLDSVIDSYFPVLEHYGERLETLEDEIVDHPSPKHVGVVHCLKRDLFALRRSVWPLREAVNGIVRDDSARFDRETRLHLRDCYDHLIQIIEVVETYRDVASTLMETYLSSTSNRMNEIMKVLTIISTIFIPLSFVASVYGMNFDTTASPWNMPELLWPFGYIAVMALMSLIAGALLYFFWRKGWLSALSPKSEATPSRPDRGPKA